MKPINPNEPKIKCPHCGVTEMPPGWSDATLVKDLFDLRALRKEGVIICDDCAYPRNYVTCPINETEEERRIRKDPPEVQYGPPKSL